jgi:hypothetical protein
MGLRLSVQGYIEGHTSQGNTIDHSENYLTQRMYDQFHVVAYDTNGDP